MCPVPHWTVLAGSTPSVLAPTGFLAIAESGDQAEIFLATISLRAKGANIARTVRLSDREFTDADGNRFDALVMEKSTLDAPGSFIATQWSPCDLDLVIGDGLLGPHNMRVSDLLWRYDLVGTPVTVQLGAEGLATAAFQTIFVGEISEITGAGPTEIGIRCVQDRKWILPLPDHTIQRNDYEDAPLASIGMPVPIIYGNFSLGRWTLSTLPGAANTSAYLAGVARAPIPMIPVNSGSNGDSPAYVCAREVSSGIERILIVDRESGRLAGTNKVIVTTDAAGNVTKELVSTEFSHFFTAILGVGESTSNNSENWLEASRADKDYTLSGYSLLDHTAGKQIYQSFLPEVSPKGQFVKAYVFLWYTKNASSAPHPRFGINHDTAADVYTDLGAAAVSYPSDTPGDLQILEVTSSVASWDDIGHSDLYVDVRAAGQIVQVHRVNLVVEYIPEMSVITPGNNGFPVETLPGMSTHKKKFWYNAPALRLAERFSHPTPDVLAFDAPAFTYDLGHDDDGSGTYTGTPSDMIEHPADAVHHLLRTYGGLSASNITTASSTFGSFTDIRSTLSGYKALIYIATMSDVEDVVADIGRQFLIWFYRRTHAANAPWVAIPWGTATTVNYRATTNVFTFTTDYVVGGGRGLSVGMTPVSAVRNIVRVNYDYDLRLRTFSEQAFITDADSRGYSGGSEIRDQAATREILAAESVTLYGRREHTANLTMVNDPATATDIRNRLFDLLYKPRVEVRFASFLNACDLERGMVIAISDEFDDFQPFPSPGSDGSWYGKKFQVVRVTRREAGATTYDVEAVEV